MVSGASNFSNSHECETDQMWDDAFSTFGGAGTRAFPALPWNWPTSGGGGTGGSSTASTTATATASASWWQPDSGLSWQWQITGTVDTSKDVDVYDIDYSSDKVFGITIDDTTKLSQIVTALSGFKNKPYCRIVFDEVPATDYRNAVDQIKQVAYIMGLPFDSTYVPDYNEAQYAARMTEYLDEFEDDVAIWEFANEINWKQTGPTATVINKITDAYNQVVARGKKTAITFLMNYQCYESADREIWTWIDANLPTSIKNGVDYALLSYYEEDCEYLPSNWTSEFNKLASRFPNSLLGFGEVGTTTTNKNNYATKYYNLAVTTPNYISGCFWWYFAEDAIPSNSFYTTMQSLNESNDTVANTVTALQAAGKRVIAHISAGTWESSKEDAGYFPSALLGDSISSAEKWLDIGDESTLPGLMRARISVINAKGFDAVEFDNINGYNNTTGFSLSAGHQLTYNKFLASASHALGLAAIFSNDHNQVDDLVDYYDGCVVDKAFEDGVEDSYLPFITQSKPVFEAEYNISLGVYCSEADLLGYAAIHKNDTLDASVTFCSAVVVQPPDPGCPPAVNASLKVYASFDNSLDFPSQWTTLDQPQNGSWAHTHVTTPTRHGGGSMKSEERDAGRGQKYRAEYLEQPRVNYPGKERWYGFSVFLPSGFSTGPGRCVVCQNHGKPTEPGQLWELSVNGGKMKTILYSGDFEAHKISGDAGTVVTNKWMDFVIHARYRKDASGVFELWRDGKKMFSQNPDTGIGSTQSTQMLIQIGAYSPGWVNSAPGGASPLILYHDEFRMAEGDNAYSLVAPECNGSSNPNPPPPHRDGLCSTEESFPDHRYSLIRPIVLLSIRMILMMALSLHIRMVLRYFRECIMPEGLSYNAKFTPNQLIGTWNYGIISGSALFKWAYRDC